MSYNFVVYESEKCVCYMKFPNSFIILCLYVDDLLIFRSDANQIYETKKFLSMNFDMKDLGHANVVLGNKISRTDRGVVLS